MIVNQWVPAAHAGDAIGDSARRTRDLLRRLGHESEIYALTIDEELVDEARPFADPAAARGDLTIFHYALPSSMTGAFAALPGGKVVQYHNVTPTAFFAPYDPALFRLALLGRAELETLVGRYDAVPRYYSTIRALMAEYRLLDERFIFTGPVPDAELAAYYRNAAVYVSLSEHEGFCAPLLEAMAADVPILAYAAAAVPETLGGAGVQFAPKDLEHAAELLGALAFDDALRGAVIAGQRRRLADFGDDRVTRDLAALIDRLS